MFGRRNPDRPLDNQTRPLDTDIDLDLLDALPDLEGTEQPKRPAAPQAEPAQSDPAWGAAAPPMLSPGLTQLLRAAENPAPPVTQELSSLYEPAQPPAPQYSGYSSATFQPELPPAVEANPDPTTDSYASMTQQPAVVYAPPPAPEPAPVAAPSPAAPSPVAPTNRARTVAESVIGPDDFFDGRYRSERGVRIQGNARGSIESRQYIYVEAGAQVEADLSAEEITVAGDFTGKIVCRGRLEVTNSGRIQGEIETALLAVHEGGSINGQLSMRGPQSEGAPAIS